MWIQSSQLGSLIGSQTQNIFPHTSWLYPTPSYPTQQPRNTQQKAVTKQKKIQKSSLKLPIIQWFRTLSIEQRQEITQIRDDVIVQLVIRLCGHQNLQFLKISVDFSTYQQKNKCHEKYIYRPFDKRQVSQNKLLAEKELLKDLRIMCIGKPSLFMDVSLLEDIDQFFVYLEAISQGHIFQSFKGHCSSNKSFDNPFWFSSLSFNSLGQWIVSQLQKSIIRKYERRNDARNLNKLLAHESSNYSVGKQFVMFCQQKKADDLPFTIKYLEGINKWLELKMHQTTSNQILEFQQMSQKMFELWTQQKTKQLLEELDDIIVDKKKTKKTQKIKKIISKCQIDVKSLENGQTEIDTINNSRDLSNENFECSDETVSQKKIDDSKSSSLQTNCHLFQNQEISEGNRNNQKQQQLQQLQQSNQKLQENKQETNNKSELQQILLQSLSDEILPEITKQQPNETQQTTVSHSQQDNSLQLKKKRKHAPKKKKKLSDKIADTLFENWLQNNIQSFVDTISTQSNKLIQYRILAFERIRQFAASLYPNNQIEGVLFGSNAVGLSLPTSDIDILLKGFQIDGNSQLVQFLEKFSSQLKKMCWVVECSIFPHAKVPIIKLELNLNFNYLDSFISYDSQQIQILKSNSSSNLEVSKPIDSLISVDITIDMKTTEGQHNHMGCDSTTFMKNRLQDQDYLYQLVLILKYLLHKKGLNKTYKGGLSSYGILIICSAFLKTEPQSSVANSLRNLLKFYSQVFNCEKQQITFSQDLGCFQQKVVMSDSCQIPFTIIDPLTNRTITSNCTSFNKIKQQFCQIKQWMGHVYERMREQLQKLGGSQLKVYQQKKKKSVDKFVRKYEQEYKLQSILGGLQKLTL